MFNFFRPFLTFLYTQLYR